MVTDRGVLTVGSARPHKQSWLVRFEEIDGRDEAERWRGTVLLGEPIDDPDELWVHELVGALVVDQFGTARGQVLRVLENPASDLLELESGALVPVRFVTEVLPGERVLVEVPAGLFDDDEGHTDGESS